MLSRFFFLSVFFSVVALPWLCFSMSRLKMINKLSKNACHHWAVSCGSCRHFFSSVDRSDYCFMIPTIRLDVCAHLSLILAQGNAAVVEEETKTKQTGEMLKYIVTFKVIENKMKKKRKRKKKRFQQK